MTLFRFHNSTEHRGFERTFLIYQALYQVIRPFSWQTLLFHKSLWTEWIKRIISDDSNPKICSMHWMLILWYLWNISYIRLLFVTFCISWLAWFTIRQIFLLLAIGSNLIPDRILYHVKNRMKFIFYLHFLNINCWQCFKIGVHILRSPSKYSGPKNLNFEKGRNVRNMNNIKISGE